LFALLFAVLFSGFGEVRAALVMPGELVAANSAVNPLPSVLIGRRDILDVIDEPLTVLLLNGTIAFPTNNQPPVNEKIVAIAGGTTYASGQYVSVRWLLQETGDAVRWGTGPAVTWRNIAQIAVSGTNTAAVTRNGELIMDGQLMGIRGVKKVTWVSHSTPPNRSVLALLENGRIEQIGPAVLSLGHVVDAKDIAGGESHAVIAHSDGTVSSVRTTGVGAEAPPLTKNAAAVFAHSSASFAVLETGELLQWGYSSYSNSFVNLTGVRKVDGGNLILGGHPAKAAPRFVSFDNRQRRGAGARVRLGVEVIGTQPVSYQWHTDGVPIRGATNEVLAFASLRATDAGNYSMTVSNAVGMAQSPEQLLEVVDLPEPVPEVWVTNFAAGGPGSLAQALGSIRDGSVIGIDLTGDIYFPGEVRVTNTLTMIGASRAYTRLHGLSKGLFFSVRPTGDLRLLNLALRYGGSSDYRNLFGSITNAGRMTIEDCTIAHNLGGYGLGPIINSGQLSIFRSLLHDNVVSISSSGDYGGRAVGGAICSVAGAVTLLDCEFIGNRVSPLGGYSYGPSAYGGAVGLLGGSVVIDSCFFLENYAKGGAGYYANGGYVSGGGALGGAIYASNAEFKIRNSTFSGQFVQAGQHGSPGYPTPLPKGGTIYAATKSTGLVEFTTILSKGGAVSSEGDASILVANSITYGATTNDPPDVSGPITSLGHNLVGRRGTVTLTEMDLHGIDPLLKPLGYNGGFSRTMLLDWSSPAIDRGTATTTLTEDDRGANRLAGRATDIGAVEMPFAAPQIRRLSANAAPLVCRGRRSAADLVSVDVWRDRAGGRHKQRFGNPRDFGER
jgi:hypothetical protein